MKFSTILKSQAKRSPQAHEAEVILIDQTGRLKDRDGIEADISTISIQTLNRFQAVNTEQTEQTGDSSSSGGANSSSTEDEADSINPQIETTSDDASDTDSNENQPQVTPFISPASKQGKGHTRRKKRKTEKARCRIKVADTQKNKDIVTVYVGWVDASATYHDIEKDLTSRNGRKSFTIKSPRVFAGPIYTSPNWHKSLIIKPFRDDFPRKEYSGNRRRDHTKIRSAVQSDVLQNGQRRHSRMHQREDHQFFRPGVRSYTHDSLGHDRGPSEQQYHYYDYSHKTQGSIQHIQSLSH